MEKFVTQTKAYRWPFCQEVVFYPDCVQFCSSSVESIIYVYILGTSAYLMDSID